jgi:hypothetical protein
VFLALAFGLLHVLNDGIILRENQKIYLCDFVTYNTKTKIKHNQAALSYVASLVV